MDQTQLLQHFDTLADTPEAVEKLRAFVLDLAVRGQLVPQTSKPDKDAAWQKFCRELDEQVHNSEPPSLFEIPDNWHWVVLDEIAEACGQKKPDARFTYIDVGAIDNVRGVVTTDLQVLDADEAPSRARKLVRSNSVIYSTVRPNLRNIAVIEKEFDPPAIVSTAFAVLHPKPFLNSRYLFLWLRSAPLQEDVAAKMKGVAYPAISDSELWQCPIPIPPPEEQRRIVAKVEELLTLCDELEARQTAAREHRTRLVRSALDHLTTAPTPVAFRSHATFFQSQFPQLTFNPVAVSTLRKAVFQLAVQGHLTNKVQPGTEKQGYWMIPANWKWVRVEDAGRVQLGRQRAPQYHTGPNMRPYLRVQNVYEARLDLSDVKHMEFSASDYEKYQLKPDDILLNEGQSAAPVGRPAIYQGEVPGACFQNTLVRFQAKETVATDYALLVFRAYMHGGRFTGKSVQTTNIAHLGAGRFAKMFFPLPPLAEQQRIVAKVDELLRWCDALEARLTAVQTTATHLLDATLHKVLNA